MTHMDEGTIHAWLDGALDAQRSAEAEQHVATCAACGAAVAEARGLIAGASRILNALDDVPANVLPIGSGRAPAARSKRVWRAAPWVTSIAAVLVFAVVMRTSNEAAKRQPTQAVAVSQSISDTARSAGPTTLVKAEAAPQRIVVTRTPTIGASSGRAVAPARQAAPPRQDQDFAARAPLTETAVTGATVGNVAPSAPALLDRAQKSMGAVVASSSPVRIDMSGCYTIPVALPPARSMAASPPPSRDANRRRTTAAPVAAMEAAPSTPRFVMAELMIQARDSGFVAREARTDSILGTWYSMSADTADVILTSGLRVRVARLARETCP